MSIADHLLTTFNNIEPHVEVFLFHAVKMFNLFWHHTEWALSKIAPVAESGLILELEDGQSSGWEDVAKETWRRRVGMYHRQWKKVTKVTTDVVRKGAKSGRDLAEGLSKEATKEMRRAMKATRVQMHI